MTSDRSFFPVPFPSGNHYITITTQGPIDVRYSEPPPRKDQRPSSKKRPGSPSEDGQPVAPSLAAPARAHKVSPSKAQQGPSGEGNKLHRPSQPDQDPSPQAEAPEPPRTDPQRPSGQAPQKQKPSHLDNIFHYSKCCGRKKAIGINYTGQTKPLKGCVNDAHNISGFLIKNWGFDSKNVRVLTDDSHDAKLLPTKANMLEAVKWLVGDAKAHDSLFFHYSGHGGQMRDSDGDEVEGHDEIIFPLDFEKKGVGIITDDTLNEILVHAVPNGCRLTALFDSCHSGSALDLVYLYHSNGTLKNSPVSPQYRAKKSSPGDVICFSGCEDSQTSADTSEEGLAVGAMSYAFITCLRKNPKQTYEELMRNIRALLRTRYSQRPQLSTSHRIDIKRRFIL